MMDEKRIVVSGLGCASCFGDEVDLFFEKILQGQSGVRRIENFDIQDYPTQIAATVKGIDPEPYISKKMLRRVDPCITYAFVAAKKALAHSQVEVEKLDKSRCGILIGSGMGGMKTFSEGVETLQSLGHKRITPFFVPYILTNMPGGLLAIDLGFLGPNYSISTACASSTNCLLAAYQHLKNGDADLMLCGGAEAAVVPIGLSGFMAIKALSTRNDAPEKASRPWDKQREGFVMGEGAGALVLETLAHAKKRKAPIFAEVLSGATNCDAHHMTEPKNGGVGIAECIKATLEKAQLKPEIIDYINAHATSTPAGDLVEIEAYRKVFGDRLKDIPINATKSMIGHSLGATGALEAITTVLCLKHQLVHPNINLEEPEEAVKDLKVFFSKATPHKQIHALSCSFGFGGHNACMLFKAYLEN